MTETAIGKQLRKQRKLLNLTQEQVAEYVGVNDSTISRWESGEINNMRRDKIARLAEVLKISPLVIMGMASAKETNIITPNHEETRFCGLSQN